MKKFNIYTAIAYTSSKPHIGNTYEVVLADAIARYKRLTGYKVYFQTGTDEHGQKIADSAFKAGLDNQQYVDKIAKEVKDVWDIMNTSYDRFVRTTDSTHKKKVSDIFEKLYNQGDIYLGTYEGLYCKPCESFFTESQLIEEKCPDCKRKVEWTKEEAYFFKLSKYEKQLKQYIKDNPNFIVPESRKNEIIKNFLEPGLQDLCVSRTSFDWGIPVSFNKNHVIYVWIDALSNYITFPGYNKIGNHDENFYKYWPADVHIIGKDILRFHTIYWPIMLMALKLDLPKQIYGHPWLLLGTDKMSKSKGNIIYADDLVHQFGVDSVRYYMLSQMPYSNDGIFTYELLIDKINANLVNNLGNLLNRTITMSYKYFEGIVLEPTKYEEIDNELKQCVLKTLLKVEEKINKFEVSKAINLIFEMFDRANKYIDETTPWLLAKDEKKKERLNTVLYNLLETLRIGGILLEAFLPETSEKILNQLNTQNKVYPKDYNFKGLEFNIQLNKPLILFKRIDKEQKLKEICKML